VPATPPNWAHRGLARVGVAAMESNEFDGAFKKKEPVRVARRRQAADDAEPDDSVPTPVAGSKKSGWGETGNDDDDSGAVAPMPRRRRQQEEESLTSTIQTRNKHDSEDEDPDEDTPIIPDLEDDQEDMAKQVAAAPSLKSSRVQSIKELDLEIDKALPSASEIGVDLGVLQAYLTPQEQVQEEDVPWDVEKELQALVSEMAREQDERDADGEPEAKAPEVSAETDAASTATAGRRRGN